MTPRQRVLAALTLALSAAAAGSAGARDVAALDFRFFPIDPALGCPGPAVATTGLTVTRRASLQRRLDRYRIDRGVPGISVAITFPDGSGWEGVSGLADVATATPVTADTAFAVGSVSKTFTAALILALHDDGSIDLETPVATILPELALDPTITIHELLDHTSGLPDFFLNARIDPALLKDRAAIWTASRTLRYVGHRLFAPGTGWAYANTNYLLLGLLAERITGQSLAVQLRTRFLDPLGLSDTVEQAGEGPKGPLAHGYRFTAGAPDTPIDLSDGTTRMPFTSVVTAAGAAGSIASTARDLARWARALYGGQVLTPATLAQMEDDATFTPTLGAPIAYGLGVEAVTIDGRPTFGHGGRVLGSRAVMRWLPVEGVAIAVVTNQSRSDPSAITRALLRIALAPDIHCP